MTAEERKARIRELQAELRPLEEKASNLRELIRFLNQDQLDEDAPLKRGDLIEYDFGAGTRKGTVAGVFSRWADNKFNYLVTAKSGNIIKVWNYSNPRKI